MSNKYNQLRSKSQGKPLTVKAYLAEPAAPIASKTTYVTAPKRNSPYCPRLVGFVLHDRPPAARASGGEGGGGSATRPATRSLLIAIVRLDEVNTEVGVATIDQAPVNALIRTPEGLEMTYYMVGEAIDNSKAKNWTAHRLPAKAKYLISEGSAIWVNVWTPDYPVTGEFATIINGKIVRKDDARTPPNVEEHPEFSSYILNVDALKLDKHPAGSLPIHARLRCAFPPHMQRILTAAEVARLQFDRVNAREDYTPAALKTWVDAYLHRHPECDGEAEAINALPVRCFHLKNGSTPTVMISVDITGGLGSSFGDWDPDYENWVRSDGAEMVPGLKHLPALADFKGSDTPEVIESVRKLKGCGYNVSAAWPDKVDGIYIRPQGATSYITVRLVLDVTSWGYPGCHNDPDYKNPFDTRHDVNVDCNLVVDKTAAMEKAAELGITEEEALEKGLAGHEYYTYRFGRTEMIVKINHSKMAVGPTDLEQISMLLVNHKIPFDAVLELDFQESAAQPNVASHFAALRRNKANLMGTSFSALELEEQIEFLVNHEEKQRSEERERWKSITAEEAEKLVTQVEQFGSDCAPDSDGTIIYQPSLIAWRMSEYLLHSGGIAVTKACVVELLSVLKQERAEEQRGKESTVNVTATPNPDYDFVFLNDFKTDPNGLSSDKYLFYALPCAVGGRPSSGIRAKTEKMIALSNSDKAVAEMDVIKAFLGDYSGVVFYYALNIDVVAQCRMQAKKRLVTESILRVLDPASSNEVSAYKGGSDFAGDGGEGLSRQNSDVSGQYRGTGGGTGSGSGGSGAEYLEDRENVNNAPKRTYSERTAPDATQNPLENLDSQFDLETEETAVASRPPPAKRRRVAPSSQSRKTAAFGESANAFQALATQELSLDVAGDHRSEEAEEMTEDAPKQEKIRTARPPAKRNGGTKKTSLVQV